ncbi:hypothetical protein DFH27DRAFT_268992 [Peziza echinospora]|nr:hypothetical protein DFH27DRAFT_268992 [Peziza echinospora]
MTEQPIATAGAGLELGVTPASAAVLSLAGVGCGGGAVDHWLRGEGGLLGCRWVGSMKSRQDGVLARWKCIMEREKMCICRWPNKSLAQKGQEAAVTQASQTAGKQVSKSQSCWKERRDGGIAARGGRKLSPCRRFFSFLSAWRCVALNALPACATGTSLALLLRGCCSLLHPFLGRQACISFPRDHPHPPPTHPPPPASPLLQGRLPSFSLLPLSVLLLFFSLSLLTRSLTALSFTAPRSVGFTRFFRRSSAAPGFSPRKTFLSFTRCHSVAQILTVNRHPI